MFELDNKVDSCFVTDGDMKAIVMEAWGVDGVIMSVGIAGVVVSVAWVIVSVTGVNIRLVIIA